jgi:hypothetical protein
MPTKKKSDDEGGVPVKTDPRYRHQNGVPVQAPVSDDSTTTTSTSPAKSTATKKGN